MTSFWQLALIATLKCVEGKRFPILPACTRRHAVDCKTVFGAADCLMRSVRCDLVSRLRFAHLPFTTRHSFLHHATPLCVRVCVHAGVPVLTCVFLLLFTPALVFIAEIQRLHPAMLVSQGAPITLTES